MEKGDTLVQIFYGTKLRNKTTLEDMESLASNPKYKEVQEDVRKMLAGILDFLERNPQTLYVGYFYDIDQKDDEGSVTGYILGLNRELELGEALDREEFGSKLHN